MAIKQLSDGGPQGTQLGQSSADLVGFYGKTPVAQQSLVTALATTPATTDIATAVNGVITALKNVGIISST